MPGSEEWNVVHFRALRAHVRAELRQIRLRAGRGRPAIIDIRSIPQKRPTDMSLLFRRSFAGEPQESCGCFAAPLAAMAEGEPPCKRQATGKGKVDRNCIYAVIPARSGSKGVKGKNIRDFCGAPCCDPIAPNSRYCDDGARGEAENGRDKMCTTECFAEQNAFHVVPKVIPDSDPALITQVPPTCAEPISERRNDRSEGQRRTQRARCFSRTGRNRANIFSRTGRTRANSGPISTEVGAVAVGRKRAPGLASVAYIAQNYARVRPMPAVRERRLSYASRGSEGTRNATSSRPRCTTSTRRPWRSFDVSGGRERRGARLCCRGCQRAGTGAPERRSRSFLAPERPGPRGRRRAASWSSSKAVRPATRASATAWCAKVRSPLPPGLGLEPKGNVLVLGRVVGARRLRPCQRAWRRRPSSRLAGLRAARGRLVCSGSGAIHGGGDPDSAGTPPGTAIGARAAA